MHILVGIIAVVAVLFGSHALIGQSFGGYLNLSAAVLVGLGPLAICIISYDFRTLLEAGRTFVRALAHGGDADQSELMKDLYRFGRFIREGRAAEAGRFLGAADTHPLLRDLGGLALQRADAEVIGDTVATVSYARMQRIKRAEEVILTLGRVAPAMGMTGTVIGMIELLSHMEAFDKLGWHWWPGPNAIASRTFDHRPACQRFGACESGCPTGAKASTDFTHWRKAIAAGAILRTGARVARLTFDKAGLVTGAEYFDRSGTLHHQAAGVTVLAANGIGTPRLLLNSASSQFPDGAANSSGLVGKRLMTHLLTSVYGIYDDELGSHLGPTGQSLQSLQFYETDVDRGFVRGAKWNLMSAPGLIRHNAWAPGTDWRSTMGQAFHRRLRRAGRYTEWGATIEDLPEEHNEVVLDPACTDSHGIPAAKMRYAIGENSRKMIGFHIDRMSEAHQAAGAVELDVFPVVRESGWHLMGTARMGNDPETSVVDQFCRSHDVPNLFVIDGSVFVTSTGVNPTATIMAIALRSMRHLASHRAEQRTAS